MLPDDDFLRNMPWCLDLADRLRFEAMVTAADVIDLSYKNLLQLLRHAMAPNIMRRTDRLQMASLSWNIVDNIHSFRQLTRGLNGPTTKQFHLDSEIITLLRNDMDHLATKIANLAKKKGAKYPVSGALMFNGPLQEDGQSFDIIMISLSGHQFPEMVSPIIDRESLTISDDVSDVQLASFGRQVNLSKLVSAVDDLVHRISDSLKQHCFQEIERLCAATGEDPVALLSKTAGGVVFVRVRMAVGETSGGSLAPRQ